MKLTTLMLASVLGATVLATAGTASADRIHGIGIGHGPVVAHGSREVVGRGGYHRGYVGRGYGLGYVDVEPVYGPGYVEPVYAPRVVVEPRVVVRPRFIERPFIHRGWHRY
jgi:hypothetical protein